MRSVLDEIFGEDKCLGVILFKKTGGLSSNYLASVGDYVLWYAKSKDQTKYRQLYKEKKPGEVGATQFKYMLNDDNTLSEVGFDNTRSLPPGKVVYHDNITPQGNTPYEFVFRGKSFKKGYKPSPENLPRIEKSGRLIALGNTPRYVRKLSDFKVYAISELWDDLAISGFSDQKVYVVSNCFKCNSALYSYATDPGDLVLDPTCGSGTTAYVAEQFRGASGAGSRWNASAPGF